MLSLRIPALRERRQDIPLLIGHFLERMNRASGQEKILSDEALKAMLSYDWPGNVRELENCLERSYAFTRGPLIHSADLPREVANMPVPESSNGNGAATGTATRRSSPWLNSKSKRSCRRISELNGDKLQAARL